jgi:hypothetical protein
MDLLQQHNTRRKHYYGYGSVIEERVFEVNETVVFWDVKREDAVV